MIGSGGSAKVYTANLKKQVIPKFAIKKFHDSNNEVVNEVS